MKPGGKGENGDATHVDFLPDADEIERSPLPWAARLTLHSLLLVVVAFVVWASLFEVDRVVEARGKLITPLPNVIVQPLETSILQSIDVRVGQVVRQDQQLATLDPTFTQADQTQLETRLRSLETQAGRLQAELGGAPAAASPGADEDSRLQARLSAEREANYRAQKAKQDEAVARLRAALETNRQDQHSVQQRLASVKELEAMQERLAEKKFVSRAMLLETRDRRLGLERETQLARNREQELKRDLAGAEADKDAFDKTWRQRTMEELLATLRDRDSIAEQLQKAQMRRKLVTLSAPSDAVVLEIAKVSAGSVVREAETLFTLVPLDSGLLAEVQIDSADIGYVKQGATARIKLDSFPFQRHGTLTGSVRTISGDAFQREGGAGGDFYLSRIEWGDSRLKRMPEHARLLPGMTLRAEIVVGKRSVISYLLWPLTKAVEESIREP